ncbi:DUF397 domain-containing protein [Streptosporangium sp. NPDC049644]|uniref:DUF397 domain-containing protein n=1 Tax=Streptosporangium sp. NPDC049644 TaxID=3155507 RepID=UPI00342519E0
MTDPTNTVWRKSSLSGSGNNCVEVAHVANQYFVRDSKDPNGATLVFSLGDWTTFLGCVKTGDFDTRP